MAPKCPFPLMCFKQLESANSKHIQPGWPLRMLSSQGRFRGASCFSCAIPEYQPQPFHHKYQDSFPPATFRFLLARGVAFHTPGIPFPRSYFCAKCTAEGPLCFGLFEMQELFIICGQHFSQGTPRTPAVKALQSVVLQPHFLDSLTLLNCQQGA